MMKRLYTSPKNLQIKRGGEKMDENVLKSLVKNWFNIKRELFEHPKVTYYKNDKRSQSKTDRLNRQWESRDSKRKALEIEIFEIIVPDDLRHLDNLEFEFRFEKATKALNIFYKDNYSLGENHGHCSICIKTGTCTYYRPPNEPHGAQNYKNIPVFNFTGQQVVNK